MSSPQSRAALLIHPAIRAMYPWEYIEKHFTSEGDKMRTKKENEAPEPKTDTWAWLDAIERPVDEDFLEAVPAKNRRNNAGWSWETCRGCS